MSYFQKLAYLLCAASIYPALLNPSQCCVEGSTYQLNYDGIISPKLLQIDPNGSSTLISDKIARSVSTDVGNGIYSLWKSVEESMEDTDFKQNCFSQSTVGNLPDAAICNLYHSTEKISLQMSFKMSCSLDSDGTPISLSIDDQETLLVEAMLDVIVTAPESYGRDILTDILPIINKSIRVESGIAQPVWSIQARPSALELFSMSQERSEKEATSLTSQNSGYSDSFDESSLEATVLSDQFLANKRLVAKVEESEVWQYTKLGSQEPVTTSLYIQSKLKHTTAFAGSARAEAFVHPSLLSHPEPSIVAIISDAPLPIMAEVLKHKNVDLIVLYTSQERLDVATTFFPHLNDCGEIEPGAKSCLDSDRILVVDTDTENSYEALKGLDGENLYFSALFYDKDDLSYDSLYDIFDMVDDDPNSVVVVNKGSAPSFDDFMYQDISENDHRATYLQRTTKLEANGGYEFGIVHVYDEPNAAPLDSTFIVVTVGSPVESKTYRRFMRKNPSPIDIDIAKTMHRSSSSYINTVLYDGPTHVSYLRPNRAWEYWYCSKNPWREMPSCSFFLPRFLNAKYHVDELEVVVDPVKGRTTKALDDIPEGYILSPHDSSVTLFFDDEHYEHLHNFVEAVPSAVLYKQMLSVIDGYGFQVSYHGFGGFVCSTANNTFMNHACNEEELNAGPLESLYFNEDGEDSYYFDPLQVRRSETFGVHTFSYRDVKKGEEILMDYKHLRDSGEVRDSEKGMCAGLGIIPIDQEKDPEVGHHQREEL